MNVELHKIFPERTLEGIKGMRRLAKFKERVARHLAEEALSGTPPGSVRSPHGPESESEGEMPRCGISESSSGSEGPMFECGDTPPPRSAM